MPVVSIITPLFNKSSYVAATIASVRAQTLVDWEMIVVDNGSTDDGPEQVRHLASQDSRIRLLSSPKRGPGTARNFGLAQATGDWVLFLDADDLIEPGYLQTQFVVAAACPKAAIIAGSWQEFQDGVDRKVVVHEPAGRDWSRPRLLDHAIAYTCWAVHAAIIRRVALEPGYEWPEDLDRYLAEDTVFWFRLVDAHAVAYSGSQGALYRTQTPGCRTQSQVVEAWFAGLHAAAVANVTWLEKKGRVPTAGQIESLFRLYLGLYAQARSQSNPPLAATARQHAESWLARRNGPSAHRESWGIQCARLVGVPTFVMLQNLQQWLRQCALIQS